MRALNALLRVFWSLFFLALGVFFVWHLQWQISRGVGSVDEFIRLAVWTFVGTFPWAIGGFLGWTAWKVARGERPAASGPAMTVGALIVLALGVGGYDLLFRQGGAIFMKGVMQRSIMSDLGSLRSALSIYYGENEGQYPADLSVFISDKYLPRGIPKAHLEWHPDSREVLVLGDTGQLTDAGGWAYSRSSGTVLINCTHTDVRDRSMSAY